MMRNLPVLIIVLVIGYLLGAKLPILAQKIGVA